MAWQVCIQIPETPDPLELVLPGGISLQHTNLEPLLQPAVAPLGPVFKLIDSVTAVAGALKSVQEALTTAPPDFGGAAKALGRLATIPPTLARLAPPLAVPVMLVGLVDIAIRALYQVRSEVLQLEQQMVGLATVEDTAHRLQDTRLLAIFDCCKSNVEQEAANLAKGMASIGHVLGLISLLGKLAALDLEVPNLSECHGRPLDQLVAPLDGVLAVLGTLRKAIPLP